MKRIIFFKIFVLLGIFFGLASISQAQFFENLQQYIDKIGGTTTSSIAPINTVTNFNFTKTLRLGDKNNEVLQLQTYLAANREIYPEGLITGYFGSLTKQAVIRFQEKYASEILWPLSLIKGTGFVGNSTIKKLNELSNISITKTTDNTIKNSVDPCIGDTMQVCSIMKTGQVITMPNKCYSDKLGYTKLCNGICPCQQVVIGTPSTTNDTIVDNQPPEENIIPEQGVKRYSCSEGKCVANATGAFLTSNCNGMCNTNVKRYSCNDNGACVLNSAGPYTTNNCSNQCVAVNKSKYLLDEIFYDRSKTSGRVWCYNEKIGDFFREDLSEDKLYYPRLKISDPVSFKKDVSLKINNFPSDPFKGCCTYGMIKICYDGTVKKHFGFEVIDNATELNKYFTISDSSIFGADFFQKNVLIFAYYTFNEEESLFKEKILDFKVDRVVYNVPDLDEIYRTNDTTPYNYQLSKYDMVIVKAAISSIVDNAKVCAFKGENKLQYYFDLIAISQQDLKKSDGTYKRISVEQEGDTNWCSIGN